MGRVPSGAGSTGVPGARSSGPGPSESPLPPLDRLFTTDERQRRRPAKRGFLPPGVHVPGMQGNLPPEAQEKLEELQDLQEKAQTVAAQKQQAETQLSEAETALDELDEIDEDTVMYREVGELLVQTDYDEAAEDLEEKVDNLEIRVQSLEKQETRVEDQFEELQEELQNMLGGAGGMMGGGPGGA
ncbi:hypothetical protein GCM10009017_18460 [Halarchaeum rubridurum]|uniref:Prefoldin subunit beta n=2 Tax=Halarchaeum rubridurum TaxID=489911 RepID=A0A830G019_9EURY|nr:hypothetical protein GCM10009017_18460 [Halarchaeum rubridurum]